MIEKLTTEQENQMNIYREKFIAKGLCAERVDRNKILVYLDRFAKEVLKKELPLVKFCKSPLDCWTQLCDDHQVEDRSFIWPYLAGQFDAGWISFYTYMKEVVGVTGMTEKLEIMEGLLDCGCIFPLEDCWYVSDRPISISMKDKRCHCDNGPSIEYSDGLKTYHLNGIKVSEWVVMTNVNTWTKEQILKVTNADERREVLRKLGPTKMMELFDYKVIDTFKVKIRRSKKEVVNHLYELVEIDAFDRKRPYLKMTNPSEKVIHIEGVSPTCKTVKDAFIFRNGTDIVPDILT